MDLINRIETFLALGDRLQKMGHDELSKVTAQANAGNPWFTYDSVRLAFTGLMHLLEQNNLESWLDEYEFAGSGEKNVGVVMAGNLPMVGIHDLICVLLSGHRLAAKLSKDDNVLIPYVRDLLFEINPELGTKIQFVERLTGIDAVIATGSDNTSRYFEYYFGKYPNIIRRNRTSVAILNGKETEKDMENLGDDLFSYFGLGCRNVSKIFLPEGFDPTLLLTCFGKFLDLADHHKYANNYHYNKSIFMVNMEDYLDCGFALFQQNEKLVSPIAVVYYDFYSDPVNLHRQLSSHWHKIQCVVTHESEFRDRLEFGSAQKPNIRNYADNVDTMQFLLTL